MSAEPLYDRILTVLQVAAELGGHKRHDLDRAMGRSRGYLSRVFRQDAPLRLADLLHLIELLDVPLTDFFGPLVVEPGPGEPPPSSRDLLARLSRALAPSGPGQPEGDPPPPSSPLPTGQDLAPTVQELVENLLREKGLLRGDG